MALSSSKSDRKFKTQAIMTSYAAVAQLKLSRVQQIAEEHKQIRAKAKARAKGKAKAKTRAVMPWEPQAASSSNDKPRIKTRGAIDDDKPKRWTAQMKKAVEIASNPKLLNWAKGFLGEVAKQKAAPTIESRIRQYTVRRQLI
jgi:hypothetical protein